jgi:hypothetical protein
MPKKKTYRKNRRTRPRSSNSFRKTNQLIGGATKAVIGLTVLNATANMASEFLKK